MGFVFDDYLILQILTQDSNKQHLKVNQAQTTIVKAHVFSAISAQMACFAADVLTGYYTICHQSVPFALWVAYLLGVPTDQRSTLAGDKWCYTSNTSAAKQARCAELAATICAMTILVCP